MYANGTPSVRHIVAKSSAVSECITPWTNEAEDGPTTGSTDAQLGSIPGKNPGTLNRKRYPGKIAAVEDIGRSWRKSIMVDDSIFEPNAK